MNIALDDQITESMRQKSTEDLLTIWQTNDCTQWSDSAFGAMSQVLTERGVVAPAQVPRVTVPDPHYRSVRDGCVSCVFHLRS